MSQPRIVLVGSINTDICVFVDEIPSKGETVLGKRFIQTHGGKGANQAVAAARLGATVTFVGRVGSDSLGREAVEALRREGINTDHVSIDQDQPSGVALILIDHNGENAIAVASGANYTLPLSEIARAEHAIAAADYVVLQLETPMETVVETVRLAGKHRRPVLLNPAPARAEPLPRELLRGCGILTPNQSELRRLVPDVDSVPAAAARLLDDGPEAVVVTLGAQGALVCDSAGARALAAFKVNPVDTVGAGDCFSGALAVSLAEGRTLDDAVRLAAAAAAVSVGRPGAQASMPTRREVEAMLLSDAGR